MHGAPCQAGAGDARGGDEEPECGHRAAHGLLPSALLSDMLLAPFCGVAFSGVTVALFAALSEGRSIRLRRVIEPAVSRRGSSMVQPIGVRKALRKSAGLPSTETEIATDCPAEAEADDRTPLGVITIDCGLEGTPAGQAVRSCASVIPASGRAANAPKLSQPHGVG